MGEACSTRDNSCKILVGKLERKRQLGAPTQRLGNNIRNGFKETGSGKLHWTQLAS
jgi:hypothetical protein